MTTLRVGTDTSKFPGAADLGAIKLLETVRELGMDGAFFRSVFELSKTVDPGELEDVVAAADDLGLYIEVGIAKVNPFATPEAPEIRRFGQGDYIAGMVKLIDAVTAAGITELWTATANYQFRIKGINACDRFRTDVDWSDQLAATAKVLTTLGPALRERGAHLNIETHEEISSWEVVRLVEDAGPDAYGITFDVANVVVRGENPMDAARRVAPYTRQSHVRDIALLPNEDGLGRFLAPVGRGIVDWPALLSTIAAGNPNATLSIEGVTRSTAEMSLFLDHPRWRPAHPDLDDAELASLIALSDRYQQQVAHGERPGLGELRRPIDAHQQLAFITDSVAALRGYLAALES